jgi:hypothetical protein
VGRCPKREGELRPDAGTGAHATNACTDARTTNACTDARTNARTDARTDACFVPEGRFVQHERQVGDGSIFAGKQGKCFTLSNHWLYIPGQQVPAAQQANGCALEIQLQTEQ